MDVSEMRTPEVEQFALEGPHCFWWGFVLQDGCDRKEGCP